MAKKPPICISLPPQPPIPDSWQNFRVVWKSQSPPYPLLDIDVTGHLTQDSPGSNHWRWENPEPTNNSLTQVHVTAPFDADFNGFAVDANDIEGIGHHAETYEPPPEPGPLNREITVWFYPDPTATTCTLTLWT